eukprot:SAG31_NODE_1715_length_7461_cov_2.903695_5_plen_422_part_00
MMHNGPTVGGIGNDASQVTVPLSPDLLHVGSRVLIRDGNSGDGGRAGTLMRVTSSSTVQVELDTGQKLWRQQGELFAESADLSKTLSKENWLASAAPIEKLDVNVDFDLTDRLKPSKNGSDGVVFARLQQRARGALCGTDRGCAAVVLKGGSTVASEYFAAKLGEYLGARVASVGLVSENGNIDGANAQWAALQRACGRVRVPASRSGWRKRLAQKTILTQALVKGCTLLEFGEEGYGKLFATSTAGLHAFGRLIGLDVLLNNYDRSGAIWANKGNFGNVMVAEKANDENGAGELLVTGIDQAVVPLTDAELSADYVRKAAQFCDELAAYLAATNGYEAQAVQEPACESQAVQEPAGLAAVREKLNVASDGLVELHCEVEVVRPLALGAAEVLGAAATTMSTVEAWTTLARAVSGDQFSHS